MKIGSRVSRVARGIPKLQHEEWTRFPVWTPALSSEARTYPDISSFLLSGGSAERIGVKRGEPSSKG